MSTIKTDQKGQKNTAKSKPGFFYKCVAHALGYGFFATIHLLRLPYFTLKKKAVTNREINQSKNLTFPLNGQAMGDLKELRLGSCRFSHSGCGAIATFNAMSVLGLEPKMEDIVDFYEHNGLILNAAMGVNPSAVKKYLKSKGLQWKFYSKSKDWDACLGKDQIAILLYWWVNRKGCGAHYVSVERTDEGINVYNEYGNRDYTHKYKDMQTFLDEGQYKRVVSMFVIDK